MEDQFLFHWFKGGDQNFFIRSKGGTELFFAPSARFSLHVLLKIAAPSVHIFLTLISVKPFTLYSISCKLIGTFLFTWRNGVINTERGGPEFFLFCLRGGGIFFSFVSGDQFF